MVAGIAEKLHFHLIFLLLKLDLVDRRLFEARDRLAERHGGPALDLGLEDGPATLSSQGSMRGAASG